MLPRHRHELSLSRMLAIATTFVLLLTASSCTLAADLRLGVFDWSGVDGTTALWGGESSKAVMSAFFIGAKLFNERDTTVFPDLERVRNCTKNITIVKYCDVGGNPKRALFDTQWMIDTYNVHAIGGYGGLESSIAGALLASKSEIPVIDHWTSAPRLTDRRVFPMYARTIPSDQSNAEVIALLMKQFNYRRVAVLYLEDGKDFANDLNQFLLTHGIEMTGIEFKYGASNNNIRESVRKISELALNVIICATWTRQLLDVAQYAHEFKLDGPSYLWVFTYMSRPPSANDYAQRPYLEGFMNGSFWVRPVADINPNWPAFSTKWQSLSNTDTVTWINTLVPPFGTKNDTDSCENLGINFTLPMDFFSKSLPIANAIWGYAADVVLTYGFAMCMTDPEGPIPSGKQLFENAMKVNFVGLSGTGLSFNNLTGNRDTNTAGFAITNWRGRNVSTVAAFDKITREFAFTTPEQVTFRRGVGMANVPEDVTAPYHEQNFLPMWAKAIGYVEFLIMVGASLACSLWVFLNRHEKIVVNAQPELLQLVLLGCIITAFSVFTLTIDDSPETIAMGLDASIACQATPVLFFAGMTLATACLTGKTWRIYKLFHNAKLRRIKINLTYVLRLVLLFQIVLCTLLAVWTGVAPLQWERTILYRNVLGYPELSTGSCAGGHASGVFVVLSFAMFLVALVVSALAAYSVRDVPEEFNESQYVLALISMAEIYFVAIPTTVAVYNFVIGRFMMLSSVVFVSVICILVFVFVPKIYRLRTGLNLWVIQTGKTTSHNGPVTPVAGGAGSVAPSNGASPPFVNRSMRMDNESMIMVHQQGSYRASADSSNTASVLPVVSSPTSDTMRKSGM